MSPPIRQQKIKKGNSLNLSIHLFEKEDSSVPLIKQRYKGGKGFKRDKYFFIDYLLNLLHPYYLLNLYVIPDIISCNPDKDLWIYE